jgi:sensor histidine kinase YesM
MVCLFFTNGLFQEKLIFLFYYIAFQKSIIFFCGILYAKKDTLSTTTFEILDIVTFFIQVFVLYSGVSIFEKHPLRITLNSTPFRLFLMLFCPVGLLAILLIIDPSTRIPSLLSQEMMTIIILLMLLVFYYLYATIIESYESRYKLEKALDETSDQLTRYRYTILMDEQVRKSRHELKNKYFYMQTLLKEHKYDQLNNYINDYIGELSTNYYGIRSNNALIDHILNTRLETAHKHNIKTCVEVLIPEDLSINEDYFCTIFLNLIDNAIEASLQVDNPDILIKLNVKGQYLICNIENKTDSALLASNAELKTTKKDKKNHGFGLKIVESTVKKANGIIDIKVEDDRFKVSVMIPFLENTHD